MWTPRDEEKWRRIAELASELLRLHDEGLKRALAKRIAKAEPVK